MMTIINNTGSGIKKSVSFPDNVVSEVYPVEWKDKSKNGDLFYSQEDFRRFKQERRQMKIRSRIAERCRNRRHNIMFETLMLPVNDTPIHHSISSSSLIMEIDNEARIELREAY
ncbi:expressed unknown protein [Seminavis robusta]|uniref:Uncharacterized protein n=1 Tax=Seminavis robusta TaxID=568900 RepID=A0A9N8HI42_9STRA|nr:expressed unknown protein [Seminavis robusta]|eukprot:Sro601_g173570.1 n/a (114) ;mRNA; r:39723-40064